jgi:pimeloyl-ACP methyl ester carboxylesterase
MPSADLQVFEDTGHLPHAEYPAEVAAALTEFLQVAEV